jgi:phage terminase large subunit-like protein
MTEEGLNLKPYSMSIGSLNRPTKEISRLILSGKVVIYPNRIDNFCFDNVVIKRDFNDNERPTKESYENKIDGVLAMIMALGTFLSGQHFDNDVFNLDFANN